jgi:hypothetical protein
MMAASIPGSLRRIDEKAREISKIRALAGKSIHLANTRPRPRAAKACEPGEKPRGASPNVSSQARRGAKIEIRADGLDGPDNAAQSSPTPVNGRRLPASHLSAKATGGKGSRAPGRTGNDETLSLSIVFWYHMGLAGA